MLLTTYYLTVGFLLLVAFIVLVVGAVIAWKRRAPGVPCWKCQLRATGAAIAAVLLLTPLWIGYFGPTALLYFHYWTPWRTHFVVSLDLNAAKQGPALDLSEGTVEYNDPWPGSWSSPGEQTVFVFVKRSSKAVPWQWVKDGTGP